MIRFFSKILMITVFFIGLGAVADTFLRCAFATQNECKFENGLEAEPDQIKLIKIKKIEGLPDKNIYFDKPSDENKIMIFQRN